MKKAIMLYIKQELIAACPSYRLAQAAARYQGFTISLGTIHAMCKHPEKYQDRAVQFFIAHETTVCLTSE